MAIAPSAITLKSTGGKLRALTSEIQVFIPNTDQSTTITAIWDTGATQTCITQKVVDELGLKPTGIGIVHTAGGEMQVNKYMVTVGLPPNLTIEGVEVPVVTLPDNKDALIGMDIITLGDFSITNKDGRTCMSFRVPSLHEIDYAKNPDLVVEEEGDAPVKES